MVSLRGAIYNHILFNAFIHNVILGVEPHAVGRLTHRSNNIKDTAKGALPFVQEQNAVQIKSWFVFEALHND